MNDFRPDHRPPQAPPRGFLSLVLTVAVHLGLVVFLFLGVSWRSKPVGSFEVGLVGAPSASSPAPSTAKPAKIEPPPPPPKIETPPPPPPKIETPPPPAPPKVETPPPVPTKAPEIATKEPDKKPKKPPEPPKQDKKPPEQPLKPIDTTKQLNQKLEQDLARTADAKKAVDLLEGGAQGRQGVSNPGNPGELDAYIAAITKKVLSNLTTPPGLSGNPKSVFEIEQVLGSKGGEVISVRLKQPSGNRALDEAFERAIRQSSPLPPPDNPAVFKRKLEIDCYPFPFK